MRRALAGLMILAVAACAEESGTATADCTNQVRYDGTVYAHYASTTLGITPLGSADQASCDDTGVPGDPPKGSYFPEDPEQVDVFAIDGYPVEQVIAVDLPQGPSSVYFAESLSSADIERISEALGGG